MKRGPGEPPSVSIIVNNYNYERFLREAIDSALGQNYPHTEVIVVDDGSTDDSRRIIAAYGDRITPVLKENGGQASAFNAGFAASRGEVVAFLDADDYLFPHAVERVVAALEPGVVTVQYRLEVVDTHGNVLGVFPPRDLPMPSGEVWRTLLEKGHYEYPPTSGNSFSRAALDQILPMPEADWRISADGYLTTVVPFLGQVRSVEEPLAAYRIHGGNRWARTGSDSLNTDRLRGDVQLYLRIRALIVEFADELGYTLPSDLSIRYTRDLVSRLVLLRLDPKKNPVASDRSLKLVYSGLRGVWLYSEYHWTTQLMYSVWFVWVGLLPLPVAKWAIAWLLIPQSRPRAAEWIRRRIRSFCGGLR